MYLNELLRLAHVGLVAQELPTLARLEREMFFKIRTFLVSSGARREQLKVSKYFAGKWLKPRPESGLDCLVSAGI